MTETDKLAYNEWVSKRDAKHDLLSLTDVAIKITEMTLREFQNPESDEYEYLVGECKMQEQLGKERRMELRRELEYINYQIEIYADNIYYR